MNRIKKRIATRLSAYRRILVWGAGGLGRQALSEWLPADRVLTVVDSNDIKTGQIVAGFTVKSAKSISESNSDCIVVCTMAYLEVFERLKKEGSTVPVFYIYALLIPEDGEAGEFKSLAVDLAIHKSAGWWQLLLDRPQVLVNVTYRLVRAARQWNFRPAEAFFGFFHTIVSSYFSIYLPPSVEAGPGLAFAHYGTVVFRGSAKVGAFCTIYHNVTLGSDEGGEAPSLGDFVTVYTGSTLLGRTVIGSHSRIGAHTLAIGFICNEGCTVVGNPARIARQYQVHDISPPRPPVQTGAVK